MNLSRFAKVLGTKLTQYSPEILTGIGLAGMITTTVMAVKATPKALKLIEQEKETLAEKDMSVSETVKVAYKPYIPAAVTGVVSMVCIIGASATNHKRNTALAAAYTLTETTLNEYKEKVIETFGEKKEQTVREAIMKDHIDQKPPVTNEVIITGSGDTLCFDDMSSRYFMSSMDKIKKAENKLNKDLIDDMYVALNDLYFELGLDSISIGDDLGWNVDDGLISLDTSAHLSPDGRPCIAISCSVHPRFDFASLG